MKYNQEYSAMFGMDAQKILQYLYEKPGSNISSELVLGMSDMYNLYDMHKLCRGRLGINHPSILKKDGKPIIEIDQGLIDYLKPDCMGGADINDKNIQTMLKSHIKNLNHFILYNF